MAAFSDYLENAICNWLRGTAMPSAPASLFVALFNGDPTDTGTGGTEVTATIRTAGRVAGPFGAPADGVIKNSAVVSFGAAAGSATVSHFALYDAASGGNMLVRGALSGGAQSIGANTNVSFPIDSLTVTVQ